MKKALAAACASFVTLLLMTFSIVGPGGFFHYTVQLIPLFLLISCAALIAGWIRGGRPLFGTIVIGTAVGLIGGYSIVVYIVSRI